MFTGSYMLGSTGIKYRNQNIQKLEWLPDGPPVRGRSEPGLIKERAELVYQLVPGRMKNLVIINTSYLDFECIQAAADIGEKYADNVIVITSLMSRLTHAIRNLAEFWNPPENEIILIVTVTSIFAEFVILRRDQSFQLYIAEYFERKPEDCSKIFPDVYRDFYPHATVFLVHDDYGNLANDLKTQYQPENCFIKSFRRWDYPILWGGIFYGDTNEQDFDPRYRIKNFSDGIETTIGRSQKRHVILPDRTPVPCDIYGFDGTPQPIQLYFFHEHFLIYEKLVYQQRKATINVIQATGSSRQLIGYFDKRGVPYLKDNAGTLNCKNLVYGSFAPNSVVKAHNPTFESEYNSSTAKTVEKESSNVVFLFQNNQCAVEAYKNDGMERIKNSEGNEWTPLYLSMANEAPEIGERAVKDYQRSPKYVIYDVFKIIGKPINEIIINPEWGFTLIEDEGIVYFQVETPSGPSGLFSQQLVISVFLKAMKIRAESAFNNTVLSEIRLSTNFKLSESQKTIFKEAALKNRLKILSFIITE
uniref:Uncharacterized protein n=1 Tax=Panagrolaimus superbus TaxID=310955 RepID=A0A914YX06_9BILA